MAARKKHGVNRIKLRSKMTPRDRILEVAQDLIADHGPEDFQLQDIAKILKVKPPALYNHFASRDDVVAEVALLGTRALIAQNWRMREEFGEDGPIEVYVQQARAYICFLFENRWYARLVLWEISNGGTPPWEETQVVDHDFRKHQDRSFKRAVAEGAFRKIRQQAYLPYLMAGAAAAALWSEYYPSGRSSTSKQLQDELEDLVRRLLEPGRA
jgi:AcrR family transcriptional regulator